MEKKEKKIELKELSDKIDALSLRIDFTNEKINDFQKIYEKKSGKFIQQLARCNSFVLMLAFTVFPLLAFILLSILLLNIFR